MGKTNIKTITVNLTKPFNSTQFNIHSCLKVSYLMKFLFGRSINIKIKIKINLFFLLTFIWLNYSLVLWGTLKVIIKAFFASQSQNFGVHTSYFQSYYYSLTGYMFPMHSQESPCMLLPSFYRFRTQNFTFWYSLLLALGFVIWYCSKKLLYLSCRLVGSAC